MKQLTILLLIPLTALLFSSHCLAQDVLKEIRVGDSKTTMLVFPAAIIDADKGAEGISIRVNKKTPTVLKVKATDGSFTPTNLTIYTEDGRMYLTRIFYDSLAGDLPVIFNAATDGVNVLARDGFNGTVSMQEVKDIAARLARFPRKLHHPSSDAGGVKLSLSNIWYKNEYLFFQFTVRNRSAIPFDLQFTKYLIRDNHRGKRSSIAEQEITPAYTYCYPGDRTPSDGQSTIVIVFSKFTIADKRHLSTVWFEKNGDRQLSLDIKGRKLLQTKPLP